MKLVTAMQPPIVRMTPPKPAAKVKPAPPAADPEQSETKMTDSTEGDLELAKSDSDASKLIHLTASRVKAPKRRPPSQAFLKDVVSLRTLH